MSLTIQLPMTTERYLRESAIREGMPLEGYIAQLLTATTAAYAERKKKPFTERELLQRVQLDVQTDDLQEYYRLQELFKLNKTTESERETLIQLNDLVEIAHAKRMAYVIQLAELRQVSIEQLMSDLGIKSISA